MLVRVRFDEDFDVIMDEKDADIFINKNEPSYLHLFDKIPIQQISLQQAQELWDSLGAD